MSLENTDMSKKYNSTTNGGAEMNWKVAIFTRYMSELNKF